MAVSVIWPTFGNKSRKTTKSYPSTGDQFCESRKTAKFDAPVDLLGRVSRTGSNYDSLEETQWPCALFGQLLETNREKRLSPIRLRGISSANREKRQSSTRRSVFSGVCRARGIATTLSIKPNGRARHFANFRKIEKTTKSDPSTGDQLGKREFLFKPVSTKFRAVPTGG